MQSQSIPDNLPSSVLEDAVDWMVKLGAGNLSDATNMQFEQWLRANPDHQSAWDELAQSMQGIQQLEVMSQQHAGHGSALRQAIGSEKISVQRRRLLRGGVAVVALGIGSSYLVNRVTPLAHLGADYVTNTGERRHISLTDGTQLGLNARSAMDVDFSNQQRLLCLYEGECLLTVVADDMRPLRVQTPHGVLQATGSGRLLVTISPERSTIMTESQALHVQTAQGQQRVLASNEAAWFDAGHIQHLAADFSARAAWVNGMLDVRNQSLGEVVESLRTYQHGWIRISPQAASLRVFGMFRLDDVTQALYSLQAVLPIHIKRYGSLVTMIDIA